MILSALRRWLLFLPVTVTALAQQPGSLDTRFLTLADTDSAPGFVVPLPDGVVLTGGSFTNYGGTGHAGLVRLNAEGTVDAAFALPAPKSVAPPVVFNGQVLFAGATNAGSITAAVIRPDGRAVFFGSFTHLGRRRTRTRSPWPMPMARWRRSRQAWPWWDGPACSTARGTASMSVAPGTWSTPRSRSSNA